MPVLGTDPENGSNVVKQASITCWQFNKILFSLFVFTKPTNLKNEYVPYFF